MLLQQVDTDGNITGSWSYGSNGWDWAYEAVQLNNGHMAVVGYGDEVGGPAPSAYLVRTDAQGQELWARGVDGASADEAYTVMEDAGADEQPVHGWHFAGHGLSRHAAVSSPSSMPTARTNGPA